MHHRARRAGEYLGALRHRRFERCAVCGRFGAMLYRRGIVPPRLVELWGLSPELAEAVARRESCHCSRCGAQLRAQRLARVLIGSAPAALGEGEPPAPSVADWVRRERTRSLRIAEINRIEGLHEVLSALPDLAYSEYQPGAAPGSVVEGVRHEDLRRLTYADRSFDVVLTSETLEHVPDLDAALSEIHRVLVPGGRHIFTVPMLPGVPATFARAELAADGTLILHAPLICHPGGDVGYPVFTEFGADWPDLLRRAGFAVTVHFGPVRVDDLAQVFECRKEDAVLADGPTAGYAPLQNAD